MVLSLSTPERRLSGMGGYRDERKPYGGKQKYANTAFGPCIVVLHDLTSRAQWGRVREAHDVHALLRATHLLLSLTHCP
jgi:hypothetical protein